VYAWLLKVARTVDLSQQRARLVGRLRRRKGRSGEGLVLVEGVRAVEEALSAGVRVAFAVTSPRLTDTELGGALGARLAGHDVATVTDDRLAHLADTERPQGVLLVCEQPKAELEDVAAPGRYAVLDGVQDPGNLGTIVRGAVAFELDAVVCLVGTVDPWGPKAVRASAGLVFRIPVVCASAASTLHFLESFDVPLFVADARGRDVQAHRGARAFALVVGNEGGGVRARIHERAAGVLGVPMGGPAESLNVGMAASILMYTLTREDDA
jgi:TrmH family RNA methyltransferase